MAFVNFAQHTGLELVNTLTKFQESVGIDIATCCGQTYDNALNMSRQCNGVKAHILSLNKFALYTPCFAHSLVGKNVVDCCTTVVGFFDVVQKIYTFSLFLSDAEINCYAHYTVVMIRYLFLNVSSIHAGRAMLTQL